MVSKENETIDAVAWTNELFPKLNFCESVKNLRMSDDVSQSELARRIGVIRQLLNTVEHKKILRNNDLVIEIVNTFGYPEFFLEVCINNLIRRKGVSDNVKVQFDQNFALSYAIENTIRN